MNALMKMNYQKGRLLLSAVHIVAAGGLLKSHGVISANTINIAHVRLFDYVRCQY